LIKISKKDFKKIIDYAKASVEEFSGAEIGGMAVLVPVEDGYQIKNPEILKQVVTSSTCTLDKEELANYYTKTMKKIGTNISFVWWHSHGSGSTFWSGTDEKAIKEYAGGKWSVSLVVNANEEYKLRVDWFAPKHASLEDTDLEIIGSENNTVPKGITDEVKEKCSKPTYATVKGSYNSRQTSLMSYNGWGDKTAETINYNNSYNSYGSGYGTTDDTYGDFQIAINDMNDALEDYHTGNLKYNQVRKIVRQVNTLLNPFGSIHLPKKKHLDSYQTHNSPLANAIQMFRTNPK
jgi:hypothetical protein|tara:strand:- start:1604 stop:2479 length:876 start_codon:yes stop_codon:yes gene_type:complete